MVSYVTFIPLAFGEKKLVQGGMYLSVLPCVINVLKVTAFPKCAENNWLGRLTVLKQHTINMYLQFCIPSSMMLTICR